MWIVAKIKSRHSVIFQKDFIQKSKGKIVFYEPKIVYPEFKSKKNVKKYKSLLENYIFCFNEDFKNENFCNKFRFIKGLQFFLSGHLHSQNEILNFINFCKSFEDQDGYITNIFFKNLVSKKAKFISGPFINMTFDIIEKQKNKLKISIGNFITTISDKKNYSYRPI